MARSLKGVTLLAVTFCLLSLRFDSVVTGTRLLCHSLFAFRANSSAPCAADTWFVGGEATIPDAGRR